MSEVDNTPFQEVALHHIMNQALSIIMIVDTKSDVHSTI